MAAQGRDYSAFSSSGGSDANRVSTVASNAASSFVTINQTSSRSNCFSCSCYTYPPPPEPFSGSIIGLLLSTVTVFFKPPFLNPSILFNSPFRSGALAGGGLKFPTGGAAGTGGAGGAPPIMPIGARPIIMGGAAGTPGARGGGGR